MANQEHLDIIKQGVALWNQWRKDNAGVEPELAGVDLSGSDLSGADLGETDLRKANLRESNLQEAKLIKADLREADLRRASFNLANLSEANLSETVLKEADLSEAVLKKSYLIRANLVRADLFEADLEKADFRWAFLIGTNLERANLTRADFRWAYLIEAKLGEADLSEANLLEANFSKADLRRVNFRDASVARSYFCDLDLSMAKGLHSIKHYGPSTIGVDTILRSKGQISEAFLQGAGIPQRFIKYLMTLAREDFSQCSSFISCSGRDMDFAAQLQHDLQKNDLHCWTIPEDMKIGDKIQHDIEQSIRIRDKLVLVLSRHVIASPWVEKEVENAFEEEIKKNTTILVPIMIDTEVMENDQAWAVDLRNSKSIIDFTNWNNSETYHKALANLLPCLKVAN
ncbi:MAG: toll/interleukin-1 receptor domain-containing protein [Deltaproteobacteria bacterium]|nr:toll/interleukin-1 receptor domain-containing protein [Deltaproteobacteria bacterium]